MLNERRDNMALSKEEKILIGKRIKEIRLEKGMTTKEFGKLLSATDSNVSSWEKGRTSPNPERLKVIAKIGGTTVEELLSVNSYDQLKMKIINHIGDKIPGITKNIAGKGIVKYYSERNSVIERTLSILLETFDNIETIDEQTIESTIKQVTLLDWISQELNNDEAILIATKIKLENIRLFVKKSYELNKIQKGDMSLNLYNTIDNNLKNNFSWIDDLLKDYGIDSSSEKDLLTAIYKSMAK